MAPFFSRRRTNAPSTSTPPQTADEARATLPQPAPPGRAVRNSSDSPRQTQETQIDPAIFGGAKSRWAQRIRELTDFSNLSDITQLTDSLLDLTRAHPSGIAQLYAGRPTRLSSLVRESVALAQARRSAAAVQARVAELTQRFGTAPLYLVIGIGHWAHYTKSMTTPGEGEVTLVHAPLLLRPVKIRELDDDVELLLEPGIEVNPEFLTALRQAGYEADVDSLTALALTPNGFAPRATILRLAELGAGYLADFELGEEIYVGPFAHPGKVLLDDLEAMAPAWRDNPVMAALAGDLEAKRRLAVQLPPRPDTDRDPDEERGVGDLDPAQQAVIDHVVAGLNVILDAPAGADVPAMLSAILADAAASGRSVLYVPATPRAGRATLAELDRLGLSDLVLDLQDPNWRANVPVRLRTGLEPRQVDVDESAIHQLRDALRATRAKLEQYTGALHSVHGSWGISAYDALQNLADLTSGPTVPITAVRLSTQTVDALTPEARGRAVVDLQRLAELGGFTLRRSDTPWWGVHVTSGDQATRVLESTQNLAEMVLPRVLSDIGRVTRETGLERPVGLKDWLEQISMLKGIRASLDDFTPQVFERSAADMVIATASHEWRKEKAVEMPLSVRRRLTKQARDLVRPGRHVDDLHAALVTVQQQREVWRRHCPAGGWPRLPQALGDVERTAIEARDLIAGLKDVFRQDLMAMPVEELRATLLQLGTDPTALRFLPEINVLLDGLNGMGLGDFVEDMSRRRVAGSAVADELELAWWASVLEAILRSDPVLAQYDGAALQDLVAEFRALDTAQVESLPGPVRRAAAVRVERAIGANKGHARELWRELARGHGADLRRLAQRYGALLFAARPVWVVPPMLVGQVLPADRCVDLVVIDSAQHTPTASLLGAIGRARQLVVVGDVGRPSTGVIDELLGTLPAAPLPTDRGQREEHIAAFLAGHGYGEVASALPARPTPSRMRLHLVQGFGVHEGGAVSVEAVPEEIERTLQVARAHVAAGEDVAVVSLSALTAQRIREAAATDPALTRVPVVDVEHAAGLSRDTVVLSVGYGKTPHGRVLHRFGPISSPEGLSLMIDTLDAVRHNLDIVSCIAPQDLDKERMTHAGARLLADLLDFASDAPATPGSSKARSLPTEGEPDRLLADLARRLEARGLVVARQFGYEGGVRLPIVVGHPSRPGELFVAVSTDDARYVAQPSLRRRDRHWAENLERHGWRTHMIFSTALFIDPVTEAARIEEKVVAAMAEIPVPETSVMFGRVVPEEPAGDSEADGHEEAEAAAATVTAGLDPRQYTDDQLDTVARAVCRAGMRPQDVVEAMRERLAITRHGMRIDAALDAAARRVCDGAGPSDDAQRGEQ